MRRKIILAANTTFAVVNFRYNLMKELTRQNYEVIVVAPKDSCVSIVKDNNWKYIEIKMNRRGTNIIDDLKLLYVYYKIYKKEKPYKILQFTIKPNIYGTLGAKLARKKVINNITGLGDIFNDESLLNRIVKLLYKISFKYPEKVFFQNDDDKNIFLKNKLIKENICGRLPGSGVDIEKFKIEDRQICDNKFKFLFLGRISENKGVRLIYEASKKLKDKYPNVEFQILGKIYQDESGHITKEELLSWEEECNIKYLGTSKDVRKEIREADCILFPSYYREGVPRSLIESAAMGKPIITTDNVGCRDIVEDNYNGFLAKRKDVNSLIEKIEKMLNISDEERIILGRNGRKKVEKEFDEKIVIERYIKAIES